MKPLGRAIFAAALLAGQNARATDEPETPGWGKRVTSDLPGGVSAPNRPAGDGVYGRFQGKFDLGFDAGAELSSGGAAGALRATAHYFFMAGVYAGYEDALGNGALRLARAISFGVDLQPAFIPRWSSDLERDGSTVDLAIDSISIGFGAYFAEPEHARFGDVRGFEGSLGFGVPLAGTTEGPWLGARGLLSWDDPKNSGSTPTRAAALLTFGWRLVIGR